MNIYQERLRQYISNTMKSRHACMGCDMGEAGPGPQGKHDPTCFLLETQEEIDKLKKDFDVMKEIAIDMWAEDECFKHHHVECPCPDEVDEEFKQRRGIK